jgi:hypothetical protein
MCFQGIIVNEYGSGSIERGTYVGGLEHGRDGKCGSNMYTGSKTGINWDTEGKNTERGSMYRAILGRGIDFLCN